MNPPEGLSMPIFQTQSRLSSFQKESCVELTAGPGVFDPSTHPLRLVATLRS